MHDLLEVNGLEACYQLLKDYSGLDFLEFFLDVFKPFEVSSIAVLHYKVEIVFSSLDVFKLDYVLVVNFGQNVDLIFQIGKKSGCEDFLLDDLHGKDLLGVVLLMALEDLAELTLAQGLLLYQVVSD